MLGDAQVAVAIESHKLYEELQSRKISMSTESIDGHRERRCLKRRRGSSCSNSSSDFSLQNNNLYRTQKRRRGSQNSDSSDDNFYSFDFVSTPEYASNDPFSTGFLEVSSRINDFIAIKRDVLIPAHYSSPLSWACSCGIVKSPRVAKGFSTISARWAAQAWYLWQNSLADEGAALASLAEGADVYKALVPDGDSLLSPTEVLRARARSAQLLRARLELYDPEYDRDTFIHFLLLFRAEISAMEVESIPIHAKYLKHVTEKAFENGTIDEQIVCMVLFSDVDLSILLMQRTTMDVDGWCTEAFRPICQQAQALVEVRTAIPSAKKPGLSNAVNIQLLSSICHETRSQLLLAEVPFTNRVCTQGSEEDLIYSYLHTTSYVNIGRLLNLYISLKERETSAYMIEDPMSAGRRYTQACLTLALIYVLRLVGHEFMFNGVDVRDVSDPIMREMHAMLHRALAYSNEDDRQVYGKAHLWIAFMGSLYEQRKTLNGKNTASGLPYTGPRFAEALRRQAKRIEVKSWEQMQAIAEEFVFSDLLTPNGSMWFEEVLSQ